MPWWALPGCGNHRICATDGVSMHLDKLMDAALRAFVVALLICAFFPVRRRFVRQLSVGFAVSLGVALLWSH